MKLKAELGHVSNVGADDDYMYNIQARQGIDERWITRWFLDISTSLQRYGEKSLVLTVPVAQREGMRFRHEVNVRQA